ncbi:MAG: LURP-one-related family protein [Clostridia bacterium]|nr:LURP-one-related family protein [Clostridia bacterium]
MKLLFKQRLFSWFDSYDIFNEAGETVYVVKGQLAWGHCLKIFDAAGNELGMVKQKLLTWLPTFEMYLQGQYLGRIKREFTFFRPRYAIDCNGWQVEGSFFEWDYTIRNAAGQSIATVTKELFNWTDTYSIEVADHRDALCALMLVLAIDAEKCSRND